MAVRGLEKFLDYFADCKSSFAVIGGCACSQWCSEADVRYRSTQDIDMVLILESKTADFFGKFWQFVKQGGYKLPSAEDSTVLHFTFCTLHLSAVRKGRSIHKLPTHCAEKIGIIYANGIGADKEDQLYI